MARARLGLVWVGLALVGLGLVGLDWVDLGLVVGIGPPYEGLQVGGGLPHPSDSGRPQNKACWV